MSSEDSIPYTVGVWIVGVITFFISWIVCTFEYGFLLGFGLGWLPSLILAFIVGWLWPLVVIAIAFILVMIFIK